MANPKISQHVLKIQKSATLRFIPKFGDRDKVMTAFVYVQFIPLSTARNRFSYLSKIFSVKMSDIRQKFVIGRR
jgi:hypothetical protein